METRFLGFGAGGGVGLIPDTDPGFGILLELSGFGVTAFLGFGGSGGVGLLPDTDPGFTLFLGFGAGGGVGPDRDRDPEFAVFLDGFGCGVGVTGFLGFAAGGGVGLLTDTYPGFGIFFELSGLGFTAFWGFGAGGGVGLDRDPECALFIDGFGRRGGGGVCLFSLLTAKDPAMFLDGFRGLAFGRLSSSLMSGRKVLLLKVRNGLGCRFLMRTLCLQRFFTGSVDPDFTLSGLGGGRIGILEKQK